MLKSFTLGVAAGVIAGAALAASAMPKKRKHHHARCMAASALHTMGDMMDHAGDMMSR